MVGSVFLYRWRWHAHLRIHRGAHLPLYLAGWETIPVYWDEDALDMLAYAEDVRWCEEEGIRSVADLAGRVVSHGDDERLWRKRCMEFNDIGCGEQIERIRHACSLFVGLVDHHDALHLLFVDPFSILYRIEVVETTSSITPCMRCNFFQYPL